MGGEEYKMRICCINLKNTSFYLELNRYSDLTRQTRLLLKLFLTKFKSTDEDELFFLKKEAWKIFLGN